MSGDTRRVQHEVLISACKFKHEFRAEIDLPVNSVTCEMKQVLK